MSKDKIEVSMNVYDIPIVIEELEKADKQIKDLQTRWNSLREWLERYKNDFLFVDAVLDKMNELEKE